MARIDDKGRGTSAVGGAGGMGRASASGGGSKGGSAGKTTGKSGLKSLKSKVAESSRYKAMAKKIATKKAGAEGPKRSISKPSSTAMAIAAGKALKGQTPKAKATAAAVEKQKQQKIWQEVERETRATKARVEKELAAIAKKRAAVEKMGAEAPKRRGTAVPNSKNATEYSRKQTSVRYQDHNGNWGWR